MHHAIWWISVLAIGAGSLFALASLARGWTRARINGLGEAIFWAVILLLTLAALATLLAVAP